MKQSIELQAEVRKAAEVGDKKKIGTIAIQHPEIDFDAPDPKTGRTAVHLALLNQHDDVFFFLLLLMIKSPPTTGQRNVSKELMNLLQAAVRKAAELGKKTMIEKIVGVYPQIAFDEPDQRTGRTAMHLAAENRRTDIFIFLLQKLGLYSLDTRDNNGFTTLELHENPIPFVSMIADPYSYHHAVGIANKKLQDSAITGELVFLRDPLAITDYLEKHPQKDRIGFIVETPNCIKDKVSATKMGTNSIVENQYLENHTSPILCVRTPEKVIFLQLDAAKSNCYALPASSSRQPQCFFFSPFLRQVSAIGCFEDAVTILVTLLSTVGLMAFLDSNSIDRTKDFSTPMTEKQLQKMLALEESCKTKELTPEQNKELINLKRLINYQKQTKIMENGFKPLPVIKEIRELTSLPMQLIPFVERFDTMRSLRVQDSKKFTQLVDSSDLVTKMLESKSATGKTCNKDLTKPQIKGATGQIRTAGLTVSQIRANLSKDDPKYDFRGACFATRAQRFFNLTHAHQKYTAACINEFMEKNIKAANKGKKAEIAAQICTLAYGHCQSLGMTAGS